MIWNRVFTRSSLRRRSVLELVIDSHPRVLADSVEVAKVRRPYVPSTNRVSVELVVADVSLTVPRQLVPGEQCAPGGMGTRPEQGCELWLKRDQSRRHVARD